MVSPISMRTAAYLGSAIVATYQFGGTIIRTAVRSITDNVLGGATEGVGGGLGSGMDAAIDQIMERLKQRVSGLNDESLGKNAGETVTTQFSAFVEGLNLDSEKSGSKIVVELEKFLKGLGFSSEKTGAAITAEVKKFLQGLDVDSGKSGETISTEFKKFFDGLGLDPEKNSEQFADTISKTADAFIKHLKLSKLSGRVGEEGSEAFNAFRENLGLGDIGQGIGEEFKDFQKSFSKEFGEGITEAVNNTFGSLLKSFTFNQLPYILLGSVLITGAPLSAYYMYYKAKDSIGSPKLATEINQRTMFTPLTQTVSSVGSAVLGSKGPRPIYNKEITERIGELTQAVGNIRKHSGYFQNVLFYGPGGTGKTMISEYIAKNSGMSYVKMSGGDLAQHIKKGQHVTELNKIMDKMNLSWRPWSTRPWILFIDEAESLCKDRSKLQTAELLELQNAFLNRTGTQSKNFMIILSTNRLEDLDEAILSRMDHKIFIGPPAEPQRAEIVQSYVPQFFSWKEQQQFFSVEQIATIARNTEGLTGRALFKMLNSIANKKMSTRDNKLTQEMIDKTVHDFVAQEKEVEQRRAQKIAKL